MTTELDHRSPVLNSHNRVFSDPTGRAALRSIQLEHAGITEVLLQSVESHIAAGTTSPRRIAKRLGVARLKVEAAVEALLATNRIRAVEGVLYV